MKKYSVLLVLLSLLFVLSGCTSSEASESIKKDIPKLDLLTVESSTYTKEYEYPGLLNAAQKVDLSSEFGGQVEEIYVNPGQEIRKGELLALLGDSEGNVELKVSFDNAQNLLKSIMDTFNSTKSVNLKSIDSANSKIKIEESNLKKAEDYRKDLYSTYVSRIDQSNTQVEKARLMYEMANTEYKNYILQSESLKQGSQNQVVETNTYRDTLNTALGNAKDLADEMEDQAEDAVDRAEDFVDNAEDYLELLENTGASQSDIMEAQIDLANAEMNLANAESQLDRVEIENDSNVDALRKNINTASTQIDGSVFQNQSNEVMISSKIDSLMFGKSLAEQGYLEAKTSLLLLKNQMEQELNIAENDIDLLLRSIDDYKLNLEFTKENVKRGENEIKTKIEELNGQIKLLQSRLKKQEIKAPFTGIVSRQYVEVGKLINIGTPMFEITNMDKLTVEWYLPESNLTVIQLGKKIEVLFSDNKYQAIITEIEPVAGKYSKKVRIEADLLAVPTVVDNTYVEVVLHEESQKNKIQIPLSAIILKYKDSFVYTFNDNSVDLVSVSLGDSVGENVVIEAGLKEGEKIILNPSKQLINN